MLGSVRCDIDVTESGIVNVVVVVEMDVGAAANGIAAVGNEVKLLLLLSKNAAIVVTSILNWCSSCWKSNQMKFKLKPLSYC